MDRNTIWGLLLIGVIIIGYTYFMRPSKEEAARQQFVYDSIARVEEKRKMEALAAEQAFNTANEENRTNHLRSTSPFYQEEGAKPAILALENDVIRLGVNTMGGTICYVELKEYVTHDSMPLVLWSREKSELDFSFYANNQSVNTKKLLFTPIFSDDQSTLTMRLFSDETKSAWFDLVYRVAPHSYMVDFNVETHHLHNFIATNTSFINLNWNLTLPQLEKSKEFENRYTGLYYRYEAGDMENLSLGKDKSERLSTGVKWVSFKQQFFSSILISKEAFSSGTVSSANTKENNYLKALSAQFDIPLRGEPEETYAMQFYFGPNDFKILRENSKADDLELQGLVNMGWKILAWFNRWCTLPLFWFLEKFISNYGIIILVLTLIIKIVLFPFTFKSYVSQAKMRVLKPQIDEINRKYPEDKMMERQQATMALYKKCGVSTMGGCLPSLLSMPILLAMFWFFPGAIELRQKSFLWATDLASYDSILDLPFNIPLYGNHVSLFCLLMTIVNVIYTVMNSKNQPQSSQMKGMNTMMYLMPVMFLFIFNNYSAGLSYYYLISLLFTILQNWITRKCIDDTKILAQLEATKNKKGAAIAAKGKSKWQLRLEEIQKEQQRQAREQAKKNARRY